MSTTGHRALPGPKGKVRRALLRRRPRDKAMAVDRYMEMFRLIGGGDYPPTEAELRARVERAVRRSYLPDGFGRQLIAIQAAPVGCGSFVAFARRPSFCTAPTIRWSHWPEERIPPPISPEHGCAWFPGWVTFCPRP